MNDNIKYMLHLQVQRRGRRSFQRLQVPDKAPWISIHHSLVAMEAHLLWSGATQSITPALLSTLVIAGELTKMDMIQVCLVILNRLQKRRIFFVHFYFNERYANTPSLYSCLIK